MAYAKINLYLNITGIRADGYHTLDMVMQEVDRADELTIRTADTLRVECAGVPQEKNLAYRAAQAFFAATGIAGGAEIIIEKRIPAQAGMGGGSADAACVLKALNEQYEAGLSLERLAQIGVTLGADVPFALYGGCCRAQGLGERLTRIENHLPVRYLIVKPRLGVQTGKAFRLADKQERRFSEERIQRCMEALRSGAAESFAEHTGNVLTEPATMLCPQIHETLTALRRLPECLCAFMTGSGSACVGMFPFGADCGAAEERMRERFPHSLCFFTEAHFAG